jgi:hypothetical protein
VWSGGDTGQGLGSGGSPYCWGDCEAAEGASAAVLDGGDNAPVYSGDWCQVLQHRGHKVKARGKAHWSEKNWRRCSP